MPRRDPDAMLGSGVADSTMRKDLKESPYDRTSSINGPQRYALSTATVTRVDYEAFTVTLRVETGEVWQPMPIPLTVPGGGARHFFGSMPEVGDVAIIGWGAQESGYTRVPYILTWLVRGATAGHDWLPTQPYNPEDFAFNATNKARFKGVVNRVRHKLRHMEPGDVLASSSKGADLVLNESVLLTNRRANEILLRDQDQALVARSLQQFHVMAGARIYAGMVQRDAHLLPTQMFSDGVWWDAPRQVDAEGRALDEFSLEESPHPTLSLTPAAVFQKGSDGLRESGLRFPSNVDPYAFLQRGLFITGEGYLARETGSEAVYGGKPYFRLSTLGSNAAVDPNVDTLTEYRVEVAHTSNGTLPVTEQSDGFDADRLPDATPNETSPLGSSQNAPFIEFVLGSVVGNDPFSQAGRETYGVPLRPTIFDGEARNPGMVSALGAPMAEHAATLFQMRPPLASGGEPTFWSLAKDGRLMASIPGRGDRFSVEASLGAGLRLGSGASAMGESIRVDADGKITLRSDRGDNESNYGVEISSDNGAVRIYGGGSTTVGGVSGRAVAAGEGDGGLPAVSIESATNLHLKATKTLRLSANALDLTNISGIRLNANAAVHIQSGDKVSTSSKVIETTATGKVIETFGGPKDALPTNMPLRETQFVGTPATGVPGGPVDKYSLLYGDRVETLTAGNHTTSVVVGSQTYSVATGAVTLRAAQNSVVVSNAGINGSAAAGNVVLSAAAGSTTISAGAGVNVSGSTIRLAAPDVSMPGTHQPAGFVLTDGCINPLTGLPFKASGVLGVPTVRIGV